MPGYSKIIKTLKKLNLSHLAPTFKAYEIHDDVVLTLTSSQLRRYLPNQEERFRREFQMLCVNNNGTVCQELGQEVGNAHGKSNTENQFSQSSTQHEMPESEQVVAKVLCNDKTTQTESSTENPLKDSTESNKKLLPTQITSNSRSSGMSDKTKSTLKKAGIIGASVVGASALAVVAAPVAIAAVGFGSVGVVAGSLAATYQATMGGYIAASSLFATLQSVGMIGLSTAASASIGIGGAAVGGATATGIVALVSKKEKKDQGTQTNEKEV